MTMWKKVKLGDCCEITSSKRIFFSEYEDSGIPFYRSKEIIELSNGQSISEQLYISENKYNDIKRKFGVPKENDILLTSVGSVGIPYIVNKDHRFYFKDGNLTWLHNYKDFVFPLYVFYWLRSDDCFKMLNNIALGAAQKALTIVKLKAVEIPLPPLSVQHRIATILSRYDSLIENYQKQIKLLEEAAQRLYKEWFVELRFPGHENTKMVDGLPEGWERKKVGDLLEKIQRTKQVPANNYQLTGNIPIIDQSKDYIAGYTDDEECLVKVSVPFIVFGDHTRVLKYIPFSFAKGADGTQLIMSNDLDKMPQTLFYNSLVNVDLSNYSYARHFKYLKEELVVVPTKEIASSYDEVVLRAYQTIHNNRKQIRLLTEARDRLLPKLMGGEMDVI